MNYSVKTLMRTGLARLLVPVALLVTAGAAWAQCINPDPLDPAKLPPRTEAFVSQTLTTQLRGVEEPGVPGTPSGINFQDIRGPAGIEYNNIAYDPVTKFLYAVQITGEGSTGGNRGLVRIGLDPVDATKVCIQPLGWPGYPTSTAPWGGDGNDFPRFDAGDIDPSKREFYVMVTATAVGNACGNPSVCMGRVIAFNIDALPSPGAPPVNLTAFSESKVFTTTPGGGPIVGTIPGGRVADWAFKDGKLYGGNAESGLLQVITPNMGTLATDPRPVFQSFPFDASGVVPGLDPTGGLSADAYGAAFFIDDILYLYRNGGIDNGGIAKVFKIDLQINPATGDPNPKIIEVVTGGVIKVDRNDGASFMSQDQGVCIQPPGGLVGWWPGDSNTNDITGYGNNAANEGGVPYVDGKFDKAFGFSGTPGQKVINTTPTADIQPTSISVDAWVKFNGEPQQARYIVGKGGLYCSHASYAIYTAQAACSGTLAFYVARSGDMELGNIAPKIQTTGDDGAIVCASVDGKNVSGKNIFTDGQWHFLVGTYDESEGIARLYVDGVEVGDSGNSGGNYPTQATPKPIYDVYTTYMGSANRDLVSTDALSIGNYALPPPIPFLGCDLPFNGGIDEVEIFNRKLTQAEITDLYNNRKCKGVEPSIVKEKLTGPDRVGIYTASPTLFSFKITYTNAAQEFPVIINDIVRAEFVITDQSLFPSDGTATFSQNQEGSATAIAWTIPAGTDCTAGCTLTVNVETVINPGKAKKGQSLYKPTSCGPLPINDGATAFKDVGAVGVYEPLVDVERVVGPSNPLVVEATGDPNDGATKECEVPKTVSGVSVAQGGSGELIVSWEANGDQALTGYNVYRGQKGECTGTGVCTPQASVDVSTLSYTDSSLTSGTEYCYVVKAVNPAGESTDAKKESQEACASAP